MTEARARIPDIRPAGRALARAALCLALALWLSGCQVVRVYRGAALRADPEQVVVGETDMGAVLRIFGAPTRIQRQRGGDVFFYRYTRQDTRTLSIEEPVITNTELFTYTEIREDSELLVVLFDDQGIVRGLGYRNGAAPLDE